MNSATRTSEPRPGPARRARGFTLVEAVVTIMITAILAVIVTVFMYKPVEGYFDSVRRAALTDAADGSLRRIAREVRTALPNSIRIAASGTGKCFEFLPTVGSGRYREALSAGGTGTVLDFTTSVTEFDVLQSSGLPPAGGFGGDTYYAVIYNLGISGADAYEALTANGNRAQIAAASAVSPLTLSSAHQFPFRSPSKSFHVIPGQSVMYSCEDGNLRRSVQAISPTLPAACPAGGKLLVSDAQCNFEYIPAVSSRSGVLALTLILAPTSAEKVSLYEEIHVSNVP